MQTETGLTPQPACLTLSTVLLLGEWHSRGHEQKAQKQAEYRRGLFAEQLVICFAWNIQFLKGSCGGVSREVCREGGLSIDPASFPQGFWLFTREGGWPFFYRHHGAKGGF